MKPKFETVELLSPTGEVVELKVVKRGLAQARPEPVDRNKPAWIKAPLPTGPRYQALKAMVRELRLHTVCQEALCPNIGECWTHGTLTVMILGDICTRACKFCAVHTGNPKGLVDPEEPRRVAEAIARMGVRYVVLTSVDRDDLPDGGASHFAATIRAIKERAPGVLVEALTPDFQGDLKAVETVLAANPEVYAQNLETVRRLTPKVRDPRAGYEQTLKVLAHAKKVRPDILTKSSLMLGLGETEEEILETLLPRNITTQILAALYENQASFFGAQMAAMDNATRNAGDLINSLTLQYNRKRQAQITTELIEIIAGAEAL